MGRSLPDGKVGSDRRQLRESQRPERLAYPQAELVPVQPPLHERNLEHVDHLLAVGVRRPQTATAACACCYLVSRPRHSRYLPERDAQSVTRLIFSPPSPDLQIP
jgi:hypothetical protein